MSDENIAARFARTIRHLLVPPPDVPSLDENVDPEIRRVEWAIARLPKRTREVFLMHRFDDLRYDRIAHRLGISEKAVEREIVRTLRAIRKAREDHARAQLSIFASRRLRRPSMMCRSPTSGDKAKAGAPRAG